MRIAQKGEQKDGMKIFLLLYTIRYSCPFLKDKLEAFNYVLTVILSSFEQSMITWPWEFDLYTRFMQVVVVRPSALVILMYESFENPWRTTVPSSWHSVKRKITNDKWIIILFYKFHNSYFFREQDHFKPLGNS